MALNLYPIIFTALLILITLIGYSFLLRSRTQKLMHQSSELAHDCETLLTLIKRASAISQHPDKTDAFLYEMEKYIKKWRAISSGQILVSNTELELIPNLVDEAVSELQSSEKFSSISFQSNIKTLPFSRINAQEFTGSIRNLLKNSAQSISEHQTGVVEVKIEEHDHQIQISIEDNGKGIPAEFQSKIFHRGATFAKTEGSGLGLSTTKARFEAWGGGISLVHSSPANGTLFRLNLPKYPAPHWFQEHLTLEVGTDVVLIDQDPSMLPFMENKMNHLFHEVDLHFFASGTACANYLKSAPTQKRFFLVEYFLSSHSIEGRTVKNGLDLIKSLNILDRSILMTDGWNHPKIQAEASALGVKILPKNYLKAINFELIDPTQKSKKIEAVLIDDHEVFRQDWQEAAASKGLFIVTCASVAEFLDRYRYLPKNTAIYIDEYLDGGLMGQNESLALAKAGFDNLHLATFDSMAIEDLPLYPHLRSVQGKTPPF